MTSPMRDIDLAIEEKARASRKRHRDGNAILDQIHVAPPMSVVTPDPKRRDQVDGAPKEHRKSA